MERGGGGGEKRKERSRAVVRPAETGAVYDLWEL